MHGNQRQPEPFLPQLGRAAIRPKSQTLPAGLLGHPEPGCIREDANMEVLQIIQGREAVPVRAIPFLTGLRKMSPDVVAQALAGMNHNGKFVGFTAYKLRTDGSIKKTLPQDWRIVALELEGIKATLNDTQTSHQTGTYVWRKQAISTLPAGVFVWRDELSEQYADSMRRTYHFDFDSSGQSFRAEPPELKFDIEVLLPQLEYLVLEGFAPAKAPAQARQSHQETPAPHPVPAAEPVPDRNARWLKVWDEESPKHEPGSQTRAIARIVAAEGAKPDTVKKGLQAAEKAREESRRAGGVASVRNKKKAPTSPFPTTVHRMK